MDWGEPIVRHFPGQIVAVVVDGSHLRAWGRTELGADRHEFFLWGHPVLLFLEVHPVVMPIRSHAQGAKQAGSDPNHAREEDKLENAQPRRQSSKWRRFRGTLGEVPAFGGPAVEASAEERSTDGGAGLGRQPRDKDFPLEIRPE